MTPIVMPPTPAKISATPILYRFINIKFNKFPSTRYLLKTFNIYSIKDCLDIINFITQLFQKITNFIGVISMV